MTGDFSFCPELARLLETRRVTGKSGKVFEGLAALSTTNNLLALLGLMLANKPERTLEIGLSFGGSALVFASSHRDLGRPPARQHVALDPFQAQVWDDSGLQVAAAAGLGGYLDFRSAFSSLELPRLVAAKDAFGLIYVDGSHLVEDVFVDAYYAIRLLSPGGIVAFDDSSNPHVAKVLRFLRTSCRDGLEEQDLAPFRSDGNGLRYRAARLMGKVQMTAFKRIGPVEREWSARYNPF